MLFSAPLPVLFNFLTGKLIIKVIKIKIYIHNLQSVYYASTGLTTEEDKYFTKN